jgi:CRP/FNR family transcriptional regulator, cyclic AMP receptor protein
MSRRSPELQQMLGTAPWAAGLAAAELCRVEAELYERRFDAGTDIELEGAPAEQWMGVVDGMVKLECADPDGRRTTFMGVSRGGWLGEGCLIDGEALRYAVVALRDSHICFMPRATFLRLLATSLSFNHFIISQLSARLAQFVALTANHRLRDSVTQVAHGVAGLFHPQLNPMTDSDIRLSQEEIGRLCGCSRQLTSRALHRLAQAGLVQVHHRGVKVLDVAGLARFVSAC